MKTFCIPSVLKHFVGAVLIAVLFLAGLPVRPVSATVAGRYVATTGNNSGNNCMNSSAPCKTVTYAINQAGSGNIIHIAGGTYTENLIVSKNLSFEGMGVDVTILDGGGTGRVVLVNAYTVSFSSLTISGGNSGTEDGGGIFNYGTLSLEEVKVANNVARSGGGILSNGTLTMTHSLVSGNKANVESTSDGGGLFLNSSHPTSITDTTISGNIATYYSGGIHDQGSGLLTLTNVTISGNTALFNGAMTNTGVAQAAVLNSTIANNNFSSGGAFGGISNYSAIINFKNTILAGNAGGNCNVGSGLYTSQGHNLDSGNTCHFTHTGDLHDTDPLLGSLAASSVSWLPTMALLAGSPAIDAGTISGYPATDERGVPRPVGTACDIGAYEFAYSIGGSTVIGGVTLTFTDGTVKHVTSASNGSYSIFVPYNWSGTVKPTKTGYTFSPANRTYTNVTANKTSQNYTPLVTITGNTGDAGVVLHYTNVTAKTVTSASNGRYTITVHYGWSGPVTPTKTGVTFNPANRTYPSLTANQTAQDYTDTRTLTSTAAYDGWILESAKGSGVGGTKDNTATTFQLGDDASNRQYRAILSFNTTSLPDTAIIQSAVLKIYQSGSTVGSISSLGSLYASIRKGYFSTSSYLQLADFNAPNTAGKVAAFGTTPVSGWYSATLNSTGRSDINKIGLTQFRLFFNLATNNNNVADYRTFVSGDGTNQPQLIITYTLP
jgi:hypothetical protein